MSIPTVEGYNDLDIPSAGQPCQTWYKVYGDLSLTERRPLIGLHGGPGCSHDYLTDLSALTSKYNIPLVLYDQIGSGRSTHLPSKAGDTSFWTEDLFMSELKALLAHLNIQNYDLLGHSWGGMLASRYASQQPKGLNKLILSSSPCDMKLWVEAQNKLREELSKEVQDILTKHENEGTTESEDYKKAVDVFYHHFLCTLKPWPDNFRTSMECLEKDPTVYLTMNGPSEFFITGSIKEWSIIEDAHHINVPTLLTNGRKDEAQDSTMAPFFKKIPKVKWVTFEKSSHMPHLEEMERYLKVVGDFLTM